MPADRPRKRDEQKAERRAQWEATRRRSNLDIYGAEKDKSDSRVFVGGRSLVRDLTKLYGLTRDPVFDSARRAVQAYGLDQGTHSEPANRLKGYLGFLDGDLFEALERMHQLRKPENLTLLPGEYSDAAERVVAEMGFPGTCFDTAVTAVRKAYAGWSKGPDAPIFPDDIGNLGNFLIVSAVPGSWLEPVHGTPPRENTRVPNNRYWRLMAAMGAVTVSLG